MMIKANELTKEERIEYARRTEMDIKDCERMLQKAIKEVRECEMYLEIQIEDNKELGNADTANDRAREHLNKAMARVQELKKHITKLERWIRELLNS